MTCVDILVGGIGFEPMPLRYERNEVPLLHPPDRREVESRLWHYATLDSASPSAVSSDSVDTSPSAPASAAA